MKYVPILLLLASPALAQQAPQSPMEQAISGKLMDEINQNIQYRAALVTLQAQMADLQKKLDEANKSETKK